MDNWLINLLVLVLLVVVLDGARRAYFKHRKTLVEPKRGSKRDFLRNVQAKSQPKQQPSARSKPQPKREFKSENKPGKHLGQKSAPENNAKKVSRDPFRSLRPDLNEDGTADSFSPSHAVAPKQQIDQARTVAAPATKLDTPPIADADLDYIDPEEAEKRRQIAAELPGSVRVVQRRKPEDANQVNRKVQQNFQSSRKPLAGSKSERQDMPDSKPNPAREAESKPVTEQVPEQVSLNLEEQVPMLMDSVADSDASPESNPLQIGEEAHHATIKQSENTESTAVSTAEKYTTESTAISLDTEASPELYQQSKPESLSGISENPATVDRREPSLDESVSLESLQSVSEPPSGEGQASEAASSPKSTNIAKSAWASAEIKLPELKFPDLRKSTAPARDTRTKRTEKSRSEKYDVEEVLILNVMAPAGDYFEGNDLLRVLLSSGLRFGDMNIFHYHCGEAGEGPVLFSLANIVVPGTFDMSEMEDFTTPGISLFLALPAEVEALKAFDTLLTTARSISEQLGGQLKDENRSVFTAQTAEHYRQRVTEFQRRKALAQAQA